MSSLKLNKKKKSHLKKRTLIILLVILFLLILSTGLIFLTYPRLKLNGDLEVVININSEYKEKGVKATFLNKDISHDVIIKGQVDTEKMGTYPLEYIIKKGIYKVSVKRVVIVKDILKPVIELVGSQEASVCKGKTYLEEGYKASDNVDGDLTEKVEVKTTEEEIIYSVKDKEGNKESVTRKLIYQDLEKPKIELVGGENYTVYQANTYREPGYKATDNCDGDLTEKVKVTGSVNTNTLGTYELVYEVTDSEGNPESIKRYVKVVTKPRGGIIYLTFDDGPNAGTTDTILNILKEEDVKATFFVTNNGPDYLIQREANEGHTVALHTASHNYAQVYSSVDNYFRDLESVHTRVLNLTGLDSRIIRFPGGSSNTVSRSYQRGIMSTLTKEVLNRGYYYYDWNVDSNDAGGANTSGAVYQNVIKGLSHYNANVVLMHDIKVQTRDAIRDIIRYGKDNGYTFAKITTDTAMVRHQVNN